MTIFVSPPRGFLIMIDFTIMTMEEVYKFFPDEIVKEASIAQGKLEEYNDYSTRLHTNNLYDTSCVKPGMCVSIRQDGRQGIITNYHLTTRGQLNGGIQVDFGNTKECFYPNQVKLCQ